MAHQWTYEEIHKEALKYNYFSDFRNNSSKAWKAAYRRGILSEVSSHMTSVVNHWSDKDLFDFASNFNSRYDMRKANDTVYSLAYRRGILDDVCSHMTGGFTYWDYNSCRNEALKYQTRYEFGKGEGKGSGAYAHARRNGFLDDICSHMIVKTADNDCLYIWKVVGEIYQTRNIYKIGVTSFRLGEERIKAVATHNRFTYEIILLTKVYGRASEIENSLLNTFKTTIPHYEGRKGFTEFRGLNDVELKQALDIVNILNKEV